MNQTKANHFHLSLVFQHSELRTQARSSVGERYIDTVEVDSSILSVPTILRLSLGLTLIVRTMNLNPNRNLFANLLARIFGAALITFNMQGDGLAQQ